MNIGQQSAAAGLPVFMALPVSEMTMPIYVNRQPYYGPAFDPIFSGGVRVDTHEVTRNDDRIHDWVKVQEIRAGAPQAARAPTTPAVSEIVMTISHDCMAPVWIVTQRTFTAARIDFTRPNGQGVEVTELSVVVGQGMIDSNAVSSRRIDGGAAGKQFRLRYKSMTYSNMAPSSPVMSQIVTTLQTNAQPARHHPGGVIVALGDGSVRVQDVVEGGRWDFTANRSF